MGLRDKFNKGGGGFLNNVDGLITDIQFTDRPQFGSADASANGGDSLFAAVTVRQDGAEADETTHLFVGKASEWVITEDGRGVIPAESGARFWAGTAWDQFYGSLVDNGFPDIDEPTEEGAPYDFSPIVGVRAHFVQVKDEGAMKRAAKNAAKSKGKINATGQRKGKDGKYYDIRTLQVSAVHSTGNAVQAPGKKAAPATAAKAPAAKPAAKGNGKAPAAQAEDISEFAQSTLVDILSSAKDGQISKSKLNLAVTKALTTDPRRDAVRKYLYDEKNLAAMVQAGLIGYDENQYLSLA